MKGAAMLLTTVLALGVGLGAGIPWTLIDATGPILQQEDSEVQEFASRIADLLTGRVDPASVPEEVLEQLHEMIQDVIVSISTHDFQVEQLEVLKGIWLPIVKENRARIERLEARVELLERLVRGDQDGGDGREE